MQSEEKEQKNREILEILGGIEVETFNFDAFFKKLKEKRKENPKINPYQSCGEHDLREGCVFISHMFLDNYINSEIGNVYVGHIMSSLINAANNFKKNGLVLQIAREFMLGKKLVVDTLFANIMNRNYRDDLIYHFMTSKESQNLSHLSEEIKNQYIEIVDKMVDIVIGIIDSQSVRANLDIGEWVYLDSGWKDHSIGMGIKLNSDGKYSILLVNSGLGLDIQKKKFARQVKNPVYVTLIFRKEKMGELLKSLFIIKLDPRKKFAENKIGYDIHDFFGNLFRGKKKDQEIFYGVLNENKEKLAYADPAEPQVSGSCTYFSLLYYLQYRVVKLARAKDGDPRNNLETYVQGKIDDFYNSIKGSITEYDLSFQDGLEQTVFYEAKGNAKNPDPHIFAKYHGANNNVGEIPEIKFILNDVENFRKFVKKFSTGNKPNSYTDLLVVHFCGEMIKAIGITKHDDNTTLGAIADNCEKIMSAAGNLITKYSTFGASNEFILRVRILKFLHDSKKLEKPIIKSDDMSYKTMKTSFYRVMAKCYVFWGQIATYGYTNFLDDLDECIDYYYKYGVVRDRSYPVLDDNDFYKDKQKAEYVSYVDFITKFYLMDMSNPIISVKNYAFSLEYRKKSLRTPDVSKMENSFNMPVERFRDMLYSKIPNMGKKILDKYFSEDIDYFATIFGSCITYNIGPDDFSMNVESYDGKDEKKFNDIKRICGVYYRDDKKDCGYDYSYLSMNNSKNRFLDEMSAFIKKHYAEFSGMISDLNGNFVGSMILDHSILNEIPDRLLDYAREYKDTKNPRNSIIFSILNKDIPAVINILENRQTYINDADVDMTIVLPFLISKLLDRERVHDIVYSSLARRRNVDLNVVRRILRANDIDSEIQIRHDGASLGYFVEAGGTEIKVNAEYDLDNLSNHLVLWHGLDKGIYKNEIVVSSEDPKRHYTFQIVDGGGTIELQNPGWGKQKYKYSGTVGDVSLLRGLRMSENLELEKSSNIWTNNTGYVLEMPDGSYFMENDGKFWFGEYEVPESPNKLYSKWAAELDNCLILKTGQKYKLLCFHSKLTDRKNDRRAKILDDSIWYINNADKGYESVKRILGSDSRYFIVDININGIMLHFDNIEDFKLYFSYIIVAGKINCIELLLQQYYSLCEDFPIKNFNTPYTPYYLYSRAGVSGHGIFTDYNIRRQKYAKKYHKVPVFDKGDVTFTKWFMIDEILGNIRNRITTKSVNLGNRSPAITAFLEEYKSCEDPSENYIKEVLKHKNEAEKIRNEAVSGILERVKVLGFQIVKICNDKKYQEYFYMLLMTTKILEFMDTVKAVCEGKNCECGEIIRMFEQLDYDKIFDQNRGMAEFLFENCFSNFITKKQHLLYKEIVKDETPEIRQMLMGQGKTSVITPLLVINRTVTSGLNIFQPVFVVLPRHLVEYSYSQIFCKKYSPVLQTRRIIHLDLKTRDIANKITQQKIIIIDDSTLKFALLQSIMPSQNKKVGAIKKLSPDKDSYFIYDEFDTLYNPLTSNFNIPAEYQNPEELGKYIDIIIQKVGEKSQSKNIINDDPGSFLDKTLEAAKKMRYLVDYGFGLKPGAENNGDYFIAIPYSAGNDPQYGSRFTDPVLTLILTCMIYYDEHFQPREMDADLLYKYFISKGWPKSMLFGVYGEIIGKIINGGNDFFDTGSIEPSYLRDDMIKTFYIKNVVIGQFFKVTTKQYNASFLDISRKNFAKNKTGFSGTVNVEIIEKNGDFKKVKGGDVKILGEVECAMLGIINRANLYYYDESANPLSVIGELVRMHEFGCVIDAAALFKNLSPRDFIDEIVAISTTGNNKKFSKYFYIGDEGEFYYTIGDGKYQLEVNPVAEENVFIYYDNKHVIGTDFPQPYRLTGICTVSERNTFSEISQAIYRMRRLNYGHTINYLALQNVFNNCEEIMTKSKQNEENRKKLSMKLLYMQDILHQNRESDTQQYEIEVFSPFGQETENDFITRNYITKTREKYKFDSTDSVSKLGKILKKDDNVIISTQLETQIETEKESETLTQKAKIVKSMSHPNPNNEKIIVKNASVYNNPDSARFWNLGPSLRISPVYQSLFSKKFTTAINAQVNLLDYSSFFGKTVSNEYLQKNRFICQDLYYYRFDSGGNKKWCLITFDEALKLNADDNFSCAIHRVPDLTEDELENNGEQYKLLPILRLLCFKNLDPVSIFRINITRELKEIYNAISTHISNIIAHHQINLPLLVCSNFNGDHVVDLLKRKNYSDLLRLVNIDPSFTEDKVNILKILFRGNPEFLDSLEKQQKGKNTPKAKKVVNINEKGQKKLQHTNPPNIKKSTAEKTPPVKPKLPVGLSLFPPPAEKLSSSRSPSPIYLSPPSSNPISQLPPVAMTPPAAMTPPVAMTPPAAMTPPVAMTPPAVSPPVAMTPPAVSPPVAMTPPAVSPPAVSPPAVSPPAVSPPAVSPPAVSPPVVPIAPPPVIAPPAQKPIKTTTPLEMTFDYPDAEKRKFWDKIQPHDIVFPTPISMSSTVYFRSDSPMSDYDETGSLDAFSDYNTDSDEEILRFAEQEKEERRNLKKWEEKKVYLYSDSEEELEKSEKKRRKFKHSDSGSSDSEYEVSDSSSSDDGDIIDFLVI